jgi:[protein-PII] uridylyltransferase
MLKARGETMQADESKASELRGEHQRNYQRKMLEIRGAFEAGASGSATIAARAAAVDELLTALWQGTVERDPKLARGVALLAIGGYGRCELFPHSDVDLLFLLDVRVVEKEVKESIRRIGQEMWDCGIRVAQTTRKLAECERYSEDNAEFTFSLMDHRHLSGDASLYAKLASETLPKLLQRDQKTILKRLIELTNERHAKYGDTLFHLEPNIKECPGGLRDVHVCGWLRMLDNSNAPDGADTGLAGSRRRRRNRGRTQWPRHTKDRRRLLDALLFPPRSQYRAIPQAHR